MKTINIKNNGNRNKHTKGKMIIYIKTYFICIKYVKYIYVRINYIYVISMSIYIRPLYTCICMSSQ